jgi:hypothetical protein
MEETSAKKFFSWAMVTLYVVVSTTVVAVLLGFPMGEIGMGVLLVVVVGLLPASFFPWERDEKDEKIRALEKRVEEMERK